MGPEWLVLIGVVIIVVGFLLKLDVIAVVIVAAIATSLVSGLSFPQILEQLGKAWTDNRTVSLFLLTLPMIALSERYGLKEQAIILINRLRALTPGRFLTMYTVIRQLTGIFGIRISGMVQFVRPIVQPMTSAAAAQTGCGDGEERGEDQGGERPLREHRQLLRAERIRRRVWRASDRQHARGLGYKVSPEEVAIASLPMIGIAAVVAALHFLLLDRRLRRDGAADGPAEPVVDPEGTHAEGAVNE